MKTSGKEKVMRFKDAIISALALVFSLTVLTGMAYSEQFQQAAVAESTGFDALAHDLFNGSKIACADDLPAAEGSAQ
jgi:hypothetical protein